MIDVVKILSLKKTGLITVTAMLMVACNQEETELLYTQKVLEHNKALQQEIDRQKKDNKTAGESNPEKLEETLVARKAELEKLKKEQGDVIEASIARRKELSKLTLQKADLEAATAELRAIFEEEIKNARNSK